jgi:hypothetical protein
MHDTGIRAGHAVSQVVNASPEDQAKAIERAQKAREAGMDQYFTKG